jgi:transcriptional regulator with XRE-family HTH domain
MTTTPMISLEEERIRRGDTEESFARFLGVSVDTYERLRFGICEVSQSVQADIAAHLGVDVTAIWEFLPRTSSHWPLDQPRWERWDVLGADGRIVGRELFIRRPPRSLRRRYDVARHRLHAHLSPEVRPMPSKAGS